jgi:hypothetical protein
MELFRRILKQSIPLVGISVVISGILTGDFRFPLGILAGGIAGLFNLRAIVGNVQSISGSNSQRITGRYIILSTFRLLGLLVILFILIWKHLINVFGLLTGLTIVFIIIIKEGLREARSM